MAGNLIIIFMRADGFLKLLDWRPVTGCLIAGYSKEFETAAGFASP